MYISQTMCVAWRNTLSDHFSVSNGVKQGGVISPNSYNIYKDHLLDNLKMSGLGCTIGLTYVGVLSYADDIVLLAPIKTALQKMLHICDKFSIKYHVNFNANKSNLVIYDVDETEDDNNKINFQNSNINVKPKAVHIGNIVGKTNENDRIDTCISEFNDRLNVLLSTFKHVHAHVKYILFKTYCIPLYGRKIWNFSCTSCTRCSTAYI